MEVAEEEIVCMETNAFGNVRPLARIDSPKRPTQTASEARQSNILRFGSDQRGIGSCKDMQRGCAGEHFTHGKQILVCQSFNFYEWRGR